MVLFLIKTRYLLWGSLVVGGTAWLTGEVLGAILGYVAILLAIKAYDTFVLK